MTVMKSWNIHAGSASWTERPSEKTNKQQQKNQTKSKECELIFRFLTDGVM